MNPSLQDQTCAQIPTYRCSPPRQAEDNKRLCFPFALLQQPFTSFRFMTRFFFTIVLFPVAFLLQAQSFEIKISGSFPGAEQREIRLMEYGDMVSWREMEIAASTIDGQGTFSFTFSRFEPGYVFFRIDHASMGLFVEPGQHYTIEFDSVDFSTLNDQINPYLNPWVFSFTIVEPSDNLNDKINQLEDILVDQFSKHFVKIRTSRDAAAFNRIKEQTDSLFSQVDNEYFRDYYRYVFGYYRHVANLSRFAAAMDEFFLARPVLYHNTQYMNFFNTAFDTYIFSGSRKITSSDLQYTVNELNSYHALMDSLGKDTLLRNEVFRELVMLKGLQDMYHNPDYSKENVTGILRHVEQNSKFPQHRSIATNIIHQLTYLEPDTPAPPFRLTDQEGNRITVPDDFAGKYLYIGFNASWCESCLLDLLALKEIHALHSENLAVLNISTDRDPSDYANFLELYDLPFVNVHFNNDFRLLDAYQVRGLPTWVLLDREGNILQFPASRPTGEFLNQLEYYLFQERRSRK